MRSHKVRIVIISKEQDQEESLSPSLSVDRLSMIFHSCRTSRKADRNVSDVIIKIGSMLDFE